MMKNDASLTPAEVAEILNIAKNTVYELIKRGELPAYRVGRKIRVDRHDVENYKRQGKQVESCPTGPVNPVTAAPLPDVAAPEGSIVISGQDMLLDILTRQLARHPRGGRAFRSHVGSFSGLLGLYHGNVHMAAVHLWDGDTGAYNVPYVRRLLPGIPTVIIHLAQRRQGFYVARGNPGNIKHWSDLTRSGVRFVNREKGCGTRVLLDEQLRLLGIPRLQIEGYVNEKNSHLTVASTVARGEADVGLGNEKVALQVRELEFIPLHLERYDLVMKKEDLDQPIFQAALEIIQSTEFKNELQGLGDYDLAETGRIVSQT